MMVIIIGKNRVEYCNVKKKDLTRHYFVTREQLYKIYPDALTPLEIRHDGAHIRNESVIIFEENGTRPYHCKYPQDYDMDSILSSIDEHKLMSAKRHGWRAFFTSGRGFNLKSFMAAFPLLLVGFIVVWSVVF